MRGGRLLFVAPQSIEDRNRHRLDVQAMHVDMPDVDLHSLDVHAMKICPKHGMIVATAVTACFTVSKTTLV